MIYNDDVVQNGHHIFVTQSRFACYLIACMYIRLGLTFGLALLNAVDHDPFGSLFFLGPTTVEAVLSVIRSQLRTRGMGS
jgi:hypothetical protein